MQTRQAEQIRTAAALVALAALACQPAAFAVDRGLGGSGVGTLSAEASYGSTTLNMNSLLGEVAASAPAVRGATGGGTPALIVDGITYPPNFGVAIDASLVDKVSYLRGPLATLYGREPAGQYVVTTRRDPDAVLDGLRPQDAPYAFNNLMRDTWVALDSMQQCDYTPAVHMPAYTLSPRKSPASQREWEAMWEDFQRSYEKYMGGPATWSCVTAPTTVRPSATRPTPAAIKTGSICPSSGVRTCSSSWRATSARPPMWPAAPAAPVRPSPRPWHPTRRTPPSPPGMPGFAVAFRRRAIS